MVCRCAQVQHGSSVAGHVGGTSWYAVQLPALLWYDVPGQSVQRRQEVLGLSSVSDVEMCRARSAARCHRARRRSRLSPRYIPISIQLFLNSHRGS